MRAGSDRDVTHRATAGRGALAWAAMLLCLLLDVPRPAFAFEIGATSLNCSVSPSPTGCRIAGAIGLPVHQQITLQALCTSAIPNCPAGSNFQYQGPAGPIAFTLDAITEIQDANAWVDGYQYNHILHFDALTQDRASNADQGLQLSSQRLIFGRAALVTQLRQPSMTSAQAHQFRALFGTYLHTLQDFYAHTNFVNAFPNAAAHLGLSSVPNQVAGTNPCLPLLPLAYPSVPYVTAGWAQFLPYLTAPLGQCAHGAPTILILLGLAPAGGMHKDNPLRPFYQEAHDAAVLDTRNFADSILGDPGNIPDNVCMVMTGNPCTPELTVTFGLGADDFGTLTIDGKTICTFDDISRAGGCTGTFKMQRGRWYSIAIDYKNRLGSNGLSLNWDQPGPGSIGYGFANSPPNLVPLANLRTAQGSGLLGQYYDLSGNLQSTVSGEGPIDAINNIYNNQVVGSWNGYGYFSLFEERLTGEISLGP
jgi:hypothetical protein